jgi:hypothetical protein
MSSRSGGVFWALVLISVGAIFLLQNLRILTADWGRLWPIFVIVLGIWLLIGNFVRPGREATTARSVPLDGARQARVEVHHGAGELRVGPSGDPATLVSNTVSGDLEQHVRRDGDRLEVQLRQQYDWAFWMWPWNWGTGNRWTMGLNRGVPIALDVRTGASDAVLDLRDVQVTDLRVDTGASSLNVTLPARGQVTARIKAGAASVKVHIPDGVAARVHGVVGVGTLNLNNARFPYRDGVHQSPDFEAAANRVDLSIEGGAASIDVY